MAQQQQAQRRRFAGGVFRGSRDPVKLTALVYLKEALLQEKYEDCAEFIATAREFGALESEIRFILENPRGTLSFKN